MCALALLLAQCPLRGQGMESAAGHSLTVSGSPADLDMEPIVVHGKKPEAPPLPVWLKQALNAPLTPTPTAFEKKIAPVVSTARNLWIMGAFIAIFAGGVAKAR